MAKTEFDFNKAVSEIEKLISAAEDPATGVEKAEKLSAQARVRIAECREFLRKERELKQ